MTFICIEMPSYKIGLGQVGKGVRFLAETLHAGLPSVPGPVPSQCRLLQRVVGRVFGNIFPLPMRCIPINRKVDSLPAVTGDSADVEISSYDKQKR